MIESWTRWSCMYLMVERFLLLLFMDIVQKALIYLKSFKFSGQF